MRNIEIDCFKHLNKTSLYMICINNKIFKIHLKRKYNAKTLLTF